MSDLFENDIDDEAFLATDDEEEPSSYESDKPLYHLKLEYSKESLYARTDSDDVLPEGTYVIVPTRYGKDIALIIGCTKHPIGAKPTDIISIDRVATKDDLKRAAALVAREADASNVFKEKVIAHGLDMKLVKTHFLLEEQKALFFFTADNRVDFRGLVKDLVAVFRMRIELRQIGVRDESRVIGGLGVCGRSLCCHAVSDKLRPVSIKMAKEQNLSLNSLKISGQCGRLMCCLAYEFDWYNEARKKLPAEGVKLPYDGTVFKITEVNPIASSIKMLGEDGRLLELDTKYFVHDGGRWRIQQTDALAVER
ncbi:MAG: hypothetical protein IJ191_04210 [Treponema sp.]|nr:hypothetical protein [Treponema sp.]